jgi:hypothetical protein
VPASYANWPAANEVTGNSNYGGVRNGAAHVTRLSPVTDLAAFLPCHHIVTRYTFAALLDYYQ